MSSDSDDGPSRFRRRNTHSKRKVLQDDDDDNNNNDDSHSLQSSTNDLADDHNEESDLKEWQPSHKLRRELGDLTDSDKDDINDKDDHGTPNPKRLRSHAQVESKQLHATKASTASPNRAERMRALTSRVHQLKKERHYFNVFGASKHVFFEWWHHEQQKQTQKQKQQQKQSPEDEKPRAKETFLIRNDDTGDLVASDDETKLLLSPLLECSLHLFSNQVEKDKNDDTIPPVPVMENVLQQGILSIQLDRLQDEQSLTVHEPAVQRLARVPHVVEMLLSFHRHSRDLENLWREVGYWLRPYVVGNRDHHHFYMDNDQNLTFFYDDSNRQPNESSATTTSPNRRSTRRHRPTRQEPGILAPLFLRINLLTALYHSLVRSQHWLTVDHLKRSELAKSLVMLYQHPQETPSLGRIAWLLLERIVVLVKQTEEESCND